MTKDIEQRKRDHLKLAQDEALNFSVSSGFDHWRFIHNALPEIDLDEVDTSTEFLNKKLRVPLLISSMSGGVQESLKLNSNLAEAAEHVGCGLALGSIRPALENHRVRDSFLVAREKAPSAVILANLGIAQVIETRSLDKLVSFCDDLKADALIIHLNPLQEAFQPEGDTQFRGALAAIKRFINEFPLPIIIKEVGQGLSLDLIHRLESIGVNMIDIAGAGGSNWISIERERLSIEQAVLKRTAVEFADWGEPTAEVLEHLKSDQLIIASGGLKRPMDLPKALALGAHLGGIAGTLLKSALTDNSTELIETLETWKSTLKMAMFGTGISRVIDFVGNRPLLKKIK